MTVLFMAVKTGHFILEVKLLSPKLITSSHVSINKSATILVYLRLYKCLTTPNFPHPGIVPVIAKYLHKYGIAQNDKTIMMTDDFCCC